MPYVGGNIDKKLLDLKHHQSARIGDIAAANKRETVKLKALLTDLDGRHDKSIGSLNSKLYVTKITKDHLVREVQKRTNKKLLGEVQRKSKHALKKDFGGGGAAGWIATSPLAKEGRPSKQLRALPTQQQYLVDGYTGWPPCPRPTKEEFAEHVGSSSAGALPRAETYTPPNTSNKSRSTKHLLTDDEQNWYAGSSLATSSFPVYPPDSSATINHDDFSLYMDNISPPSSQVHNTATFLKAKQLETSRLNSSTSPTRSTLKDFPPDFNKNARFDNTPVAAQVERTIYPFHLLSYEHEKHAPRTLIQQRSQAPFSPKQFPVLAASYYRKFSKHEFDNDGKHREIPTGDGLPPAASQTGKSTTAITVTLPAVTRHNLRQPPPPPNTPRKPTLENRPSELTGYEVVTNEEIRGLRNGQFFRRYSESAPESVESVRTTNSPRYETQRSVIDKALETITHANKPI